MFQSFLLLVIAIFGLFLPVIAQHRNDTRQKTETACLAEWRARAKGMTQKAFVAQCRSGHAEPQASANTAEPSTNGTATPLQESSRPSAHPAQRRVTERHSRHHARPRVENQASRPAPADSSGGF
jgi:hypothetical protein